MRLGGVDGELRPWHYTYVYSIESRLIMRVRYDTKAPVPDENMTLRPTRTAPSSAAFNRCSSFYKLDQVSVHTLQYKTHLHELNEEPRERVLYGQPTGPNPLYHRDD